MNIQTNNNSKNAASSACAACKHQRKRCRPDCALARYFPASNPQQFKDVHRLFRVSNVTKILDSVPSARERDRAMQSIIFEAGARRRDPVHGVVGILRGLFDRVEATQMELESLRRQIAFQKCFRIQRAQMQQTQMGMFTNI
ncbi:LOB domain-containing protein 7 [Acorus calamus]|uniref:LOB domain-containing protein 7 n=1 Tax=Acorus calamus TaxID=4465 RepID=A0AAV9DAG5_ACOCL|nr:LOB domain-containing protein 7 [Acorus calamus]